MLYSAQYAAQYVAQPLVKQLAPTCKASEPYSLNNAKPKRELLDCSASLATTERSTPWN